MLVFFKLFASFLFYESIYNIIENKVFNNDYSQNSQYSQYSQNSIINQKRSKNLVCFIHNISSIILSFLKINNVFDNDLLVYWSSSYFIWDINMILKSNQKSISYIYHHLITIWLLFSIHKFNFLLFVFYLGEISNFWNYIVYDLYKINFDENKLLIIKKIQVLWLIYFRGILFSHYIYNYYGESKQQNHYLTYNLIVIYLLGIIWFSNILIGVLKQDFEFIMVVGLLPFIFLTNFYDGFVKYTSMYIVTFGFNQHWFIHNDITYYIDVLSNIFFCILINYYTKFQPQTYLITMLMAITFCFNKKSTILHTLLIQFPAFFALKNFYM
jgi:hypothetical protein